MEKLEDKNNMDLISRTIILVIILILGVEVAFFTHEPVRLRRTVQGSLPAGRHGALRNPGKKGAADFSPQGSTDFTLARIVRKSAQTPIQQFSNYVGEDNTQEILKELGKLNYTPQEVDKAIEEMVEFIPMDKAPHGWWEEVSNAGMSLACLILAKALDTKYYLLHEGDFWEKVNVFNGKSLVGLRGYFRRRSVHELIERFSHLKEKYFDDPEIKTFYILGKALKIFPHTDKQWAERIAKSSYFLWSWLKYEPEMEKSIIERAFKKEILPRFKEELTGIEYFNFKQRVPYELVKAYMFKENVNFLNRTLRGTYESHGRNIVKMKRTFGWYPDIEDKYLWINFIRLMQPQWSKNEIPTQIIEHFLLRIAQERHKKLEDLKDGKDFFNLDFLSWKKIGIEAKSLRNSLVTFFNGILNLREEVIIPLNEKINKEVEEIKKEVSQKHRVGSIDKYSLWAIKRYIEQEILKPQDKSWKKLKSADLPKGILSVSPTKSPFFGRLNFLKSVLWVDLDLSERITEHPIKTEDWVTKLLWWGDIDWEETPIGVRKDWVRMLATQLDMSVERLLNKPATSNIWDKRINFKSDPLDIFSSTFDELIPFMPSTDRIKEDVLTLRPLLEKVYHSNPNKLRQDLFGGK